MQRLGLGPLAAVELLCVVALACSGEKSGTEKPNARETGGQGSAVGGMTGAPVGQGGSTGTAAGPSSSGTPAIPAGATSSTDTGGTSASFGGSTGTGTGGRIVFANAGYCGAVVLLPPVTNNGGAADVCNQLSVVAEPAVPTVLLLVDNSSSMFEPEGKGPWGFLYEALMNTDLLSSMQSKVRFGFTSFKGNTVAQMNETDPACAELTSVPYALDNFDAIKTVYTGLGTEWMPGIKWETPTGHAITRAAADLAAYEDDPPGPKAILLVTDGNPNTCQIIDPQCGQDLSIKAVQDAYAAGIQTFTIGIGEVIEGNVGCQPEWGRCGPLHLQDLANAGKGLPVLPPPETFIWQSCADRYGRVLMGTYDAAATEMAPYFTATSGAELRTAVEQLLADVLSCSFEMDAIVTGNPAIGSVKVGGQAVAYGEADGWKLEDNRYQVTLQGAACDLFKTARTIDISFPCDPLTGEPIAIKR
jgi:hypothetical protein